MLILTRQEGAALILTMPDGREIEFVVCGIEYRGRGRSRVKVGIVAPADVSIVRDELVRRDERKRA